MKVETAKQIAYCIPVVQQVLGGVTLVAGLARVIFDAFRADLSKGVKLQYIKADLRLMAKGVLLLLPVISTIFFLIVLLKKPQDEELPQAKSALFNEKKEDLFNEETKKELKILFDSKANDEIKVSGYKYSKNENTIEINNTWSFSITLEQELLEKDPLFILDALAMKVNFNDWQRLESSLIVNFLLKEAVGRGPLKHFLTTLMQSAVPLLLDAKTKMPLTETNGVNNANRLRVLGYLLRIAVINKYPMGCLFLTQLFQMLIAIKQDKRNLNFLKMYASSAHHEDVFENELLFFLGLPMHVLTAKQWQKMAIGLLGMNEDVIQEWPRDEKGGLKLLSHSELKKLDLIKIRDAVAQIYTEGSEVAVKENEECDGQKIQNFFFKKANEDKPFLEILKNVYAIAEGFYNSRTDVTPVIETQASDLQLQIEGESVTAENIIRFFDPESTASQKTKDHLQRWILEKKDDQKWLTQFVFATTALKSLSAKMTKIRVDEEYSDSSRISFATCFSKIRINMDLIELYAVKNNKDEYEFFKECLEEAVLNGQTDFGRG